MKFLILNVCVCVWSVNVCVLLAARCQLDVDFGFQCTDFVQRWFFDRTVAACSPFWFGGCGGNANRFSSEHECFRTCGVQSKSSLTVTGCCRCLFAVDLTYSDLFSLSDPNKRLQPEIMVFSKGDHSLLSLQVIHQSCRWKRFSSLALALDPGGCQDYAMMWFFDTVQNECIRFWYGGCDGNANRFETQEECENLCLTHIRKSQDLMSPEGGNLNRTTWLKAAAV
uniref:BPTI/Kunitz inhibitor domain-containing protein n=1 Tax=Xiphophorus couchianus TaxID=32473 RepID=A0A3B5MVZ4_9TELE